MTLKSLSLAAAAVALAAAPLNAQAPMERASEEIEGNELTGTTGIVAILFAAAAVIGLVIIIDDSDDDAVSP